MTTSINNLLKWGLALGAVALAILLIGNVLAYLVAASLVTLLLSPLVGWLVERRLFGRYLNRNLAVLITLVGTLLVILTLFGVLLPLGLADFKQLAALEPQRMVTNLRASLESVSAFLARHNIQLDVEASLRAFFQRNLESILGMDNLGPALKSAMKSIGSVSIAIGATLFISFFLLREPKMLPRLLLVMAPPRWRIRLSRTMLRSQRLLRRYFGGILLKSTIMATLVSIGLGILGVPGAIIFGLLYGLFDIIPYAGPFISGATLLLLSSSIELSQPDPALDVLLLKLIGAVAVAQMTDTYLLEPIIFGNSVRAHPLEIFLVILVAGTLAGIGGMILAIPAYTMLRVLIFEFFADQRFIRYLAANAAAKRRAASS